MNNPWGLGLLLLIVLFLASWNYYFPFIPILGPTESTEATMVGQGFQYGPGGRGAVQRGILSYWVGDSLYTTVRRLDARRGPLAIGSKVWIDYAEKDPHDIRIKAYVQVAPRITPTSYYAASSGQRTVLRLYGTILTSHTSTLKGQALDSTALEYAWRGDTLLAYPVGRMGEGVPLRSYVMEPERNTLTDLGSGWCFRPASR